MSTDLHKRMLEFNYGDPEVAELMRDVWAATPWMVDAFTGDYGREREILEWCYEQFGPQASQIHGKPGTWYRGSATVYGHTWFGFATAEQLARFAQRWPTPAGEVAPGADAPVLRFP